MTKLEKAIRRELVIKDVTYTVVIDPTSSADVPSSISVPASTL